MKYTELKKKKELDQLGIFTENINSIKIIEWPELIEVNISDVLEIHFKYSKKENQRDLILKGKGKWKKFKFDES